MSRRSRPSIPQELHQLKAQEIYEQRIAKGKNGNPEGDWETARRYLTRYPKVVRAWKRGQAIAFYQQLPRSFFRRLWRSLKALISVIWKIIIFPLWLFYKLPQLFANTDTRPFALDVVKTIISAASLIAAIIAAIGLFFNILDARQDREDARQDRQLTQERLITDRFTKAVAQIGNDKEEVVIGGIYSLERIAKDSPKDQWTIMEVLTAFVRKNSPILPESQEIQERSEEKLKASEKLDPINIQIQAALTVIGRRDIKRDYASDEDLDQNIKRLDLTNSNLSSANLFSANLSIANLRDANLNSVNLNSADLRGADLNNANLFSADLRDANLNSANLNSANLFSANLRDANLRGAKLFSADLRDANLNSANLNSAYLFRANLNSANLRGADLRDADLSSADLRDADLRGTNLSSAYLSSADLRGADLRGANFNSFEKLISNRQIKSACFWEEAIYTDAEWNYIRRKWIAVNEKVNQKRIEEIRQDKASDPKNPPDCNKWK